MNLLNLLTFEPHLEVFRMASFGKAYNDEKDEWYITQLKTTMNFDTPVMCPDGKGSCAQSIKHHIHTCN